MKTSTKILITFLGSFIILVGILGSLYTILPYLGINLFKDTGSLGAIILFQSCLLISIPITYFKIKDDLKEIDLFNFPTIREKSKLVNNLKDEIKKFLEKGLYNDVIHYGSSISRVLWLNGEYSARIKIGEMVDEAATALNKLDIKASTLIDDIGWTLVPLKKYDEAAKNIKKGIEIAQSIPDYYLLAKGKRHLSGIEIEKNNHNSAIHYLKESENYANSVGDSKKKTEMLGGIQYGMAEAYYLKGNYKKAKEYCEKVKELFVQIDDKSRLAKYYAQMGKILEAELNEDNARDYYLQGVEFSKNCQRVDELIRNRLGLARIYANKNDKKRAQINLKDAKKLLQRTPVFFFGDINSELKNIEEKIRRLK